ncbi:MAG: alpha-E domain-containing protein, partial [Pseudomonadota bacterium]
QMSRLLDVRFAQRQADDADTAKLIGDPTHWIMLLRACGGHHAFRRLVSGPTQPENVARFLIFENSFARSLSHSIGQMEGAVDELRRVCSIPVPMSLLKRLNELRDMLHFAQNDPGLTVHLHSFNDALQQELIAITNDVSTHYFVIEVDKSADLLSTPPPSEDQEPDWVQPPDPDKAVQPETAADPASKEAHGSLKHHASQSQKQS